MKKLIKSLALSVMLLMIFSLTAFASETISPPSLVGAKAISSSVIVIGWVQVPDADYYHLYYSGNIDGPYQTFNNKLGSDHIEWIGAYSARLTGIPVNTTVYFKVTAIKNDTESEDSVISSAKTTYESDTHGSLKLVADDLDRTYLGSLSTNKLDSDSIFNEFGTYGNKFSSKSIWDEFGFYGGKFSAYSPFNEFTAMPPLIEDSEGNILGRLTVNKFVTGAVDPSLIYDTLTNLGL